MCNTLCDSEESAGESAEKARNEAHDLLEQLTVFQDAYETFRATIQTSRMLAHDANMFLETAKAFKEEVDNAVANGIMEINQKEKSDLKDEVEQEASGTVQAVLIWILDTTPDCDLREKIERFNQSLTEYALLEDEKDHEYPEEYFKRLLH